MKTLCGSTGLASASWCAAAIAFAAFNAAPAAWAQNTDGKTAAPPASAENKPIIAGRIYVTIRTLRDAGGLPTEGRDKNLNVQFAAGLRKYLTDAGKARFEVDETTTETGKPPLNARVLTVEGDLSRTSDGQGGGPFLAVVRLYQEKNGTTPRKLIAQWAGIADNYRYLTGNLDSRADVDKEGLLGELGKRIASSVVPPARSNSTFAALVDKAAQTKRVLATLLPEKAEGSGGETGDGPTSLAAPVVRSEQGYRVRVASQNRGAVYVVRDEGSDRLLPLFVPEKNDELRFVEPNKPLIVPGSPSKAWIAPRTDHAVEQTLIVLVRRRLDTGEVLSMPPPIAAATSPKDGGTVLPPLPVRVLGTGAADPDAASNPLINRLAGWMTSDPDGTWTAQRLVVHIVPGGSSKGSRPLPSVE